MVSLSSRSSRSRSTRSSASSGNWFNRLNFMQQVKFVGLQRRAQARARRRKQVANLLAKKSDARKALIALRAIARKRAAARRQKRQSKAAGKSAVYRAIYSRGGGSALANYAASFV